MRLYVHYEAEREADAWTKRVTLPTAPDAAAAASVRDVLAAFQSAYAAKFRRAFPVATAELDVFVEAGPPDAARRQRLADLDAPLLQAASSAVLEFGEFELVVARRTRDPASANTPTSEERSPPHKPPCCHRHPHRHHRKGGSSSSNTTADECNECEDGEDTEDDGDSRDPKLRAVLELAAAQMKQQKFRAARELHETIVLPAEPLNPEALLALGDILLANGRHDAAAKGYYLKCWRAHGLARSPANEQLASLKARAKAPKRPAASKAYARLAFTCALRLAGCYVETHKYARAVEILDELQVFLRSNSSPCKSPTGARTRPFFPDAKERGWMETQMDVLKARALYESKVPDHQERAIALVMHMLPDLQAPLVNLDALLLYARIAHDRGKKSEALSMALRVLVGKSNDSAVKKTLVALLKGPRAMERLQSAVPARSPSSGAAYAFIATILKDYGALEASILCFQQARLSDSSSASYVLNHAHALEADNRYDGAFRVLSSFFRVNSWLSVGVGIGSGCVTAGMFVKVLDEENAWGTKQAEDRVAKNGSSAVQWSRVEWADSEGGFARVLSENGKSVSEPSADNFVHNKRLALMENELDLLACFFTVIKILFVNGKLAVIPALIRLLEPVRVARDLHRTAIRNEQAYYSCIAQLLSLEDGLVSQPPEIPAPVPGVDAAADPSVVYVCGDSHTLPTAWRELTVHGERVLLRPALVTGLKHWHLRKDSTFYPKINFWRVLASIPPRSKVVFLFGEIDCREGILNAVEKCKYETIEEGMNHTIGIFMEVLADVLDKYEFEAFIHPVVPVLNETRHLVIQYNDIFKRRVDACKTCTWLDFFDVLLQDSPPKLRPEFALDGTHLHPRYLRLLEAELDKSVSTSS